MANKKKINRTETTMTGNRLQSILIGLLVVAAFAIGSLWTELKMKKNDQQTQETVAPEKNKQDEADDGLLEEIWQEMLKQPLAVKGVDEAPVKIVEFSEYLCPFCAEYTGVDIVPSKPIDEEKAYQQIIENYVDTGKVQYIFRDYPVHGEKAIVIGAAAYCAGEQGQYWQYHDLLFVEQKNLTVVVELETALKKLATTIGLNSDIFNQCLTDNKTVSEVNKNFALGKKAGVMGTPTFFINGQKLVGANPYMAFEKIIEAKLQ